MRLTGYLVLAAATAFPVFGLESINYGSFVQSAAFSIANQLGFFTAAGLNVTYLQIPNSTFGYNALLTGAYDILSGNIDNVVNLRFNQNKSISVIGQLDASPDIVLAAAPNITDIQQLRGQPIIVDSPVSGYAYLLRKILSLHGLKLENGDYYFQTVGGTNLRYQYLTAGALPNGTAVVAAILTYPFTAYSEALPAKNRPNILARVSDYVNPFANSVLTVTPASIATTSPKHNATVRYFAATLAATQYLANTTNENCVLEAIAKQLNITTALAEREYAAATDPITGESIFAAQTLNVSRQGLLNVIDVRGQFGGFAGINGGEGFDFNTALQPGPGKIIDYSMRDKALATKWDDLTALVDQGDGLCHEKGF